MSVNFIQYRPGAHIRADLSRRFYLIHRVLSGKCRMGAGTAARSLAAGDFAVINPTEPFTVRTSDDCGQIVIKLEAKLLNDIAHRRFSIGRNAPLKFHGHRPSRNTDALADIIDLICREADRHGRGDGSQTTEAMLAELFAVALIEALPHNHSDALNRDRRTGRIAPWYVRRVEEFIELHADQPMRIGDMTAVAGVSERTLYQAFRDWRDVSPKAYLKSVRLDRARTELLGLESKAKGVGEIARACGFSHLGNFARDYRARFGERPVDTLRFRLSDDDGDS